MTIHDATEQAYKNGYEAAKNELEDTICFEAGYYDKLIEEIKQLENKNAELKEIIIAMCKNLFMGNRIV